MGDEVEEPKVPCTGEVFTTNPPKCVHWVALHREIESLRASLTRVEGERDALKAKHGLFPEEHAYMALLRLPITGALRATPEIQSAMATCVDWLAAFVGHEPQQVQEFYEERVALEDDRLSRPVVPEGK